MQKKVLILTYYWPPSGGGGVQRWIKFVKYLRVNGWEPIVVIPKNAEYPILDDSIHDEIPEGIEIIESKIWEPYKLYRSLTGDKDKTVSAGFVSSSTKKSKAKKFAQWVRGNLFFPDARKFWIKPTSKLIVKRFEKEPFDAIITTGPPFSLHLIGQKVQKKTGVKWFADFRDPWTEMDNLKAFQFSEKMFKRHQDSEAEVLKNADMVATVSWYLSNVYQEKSKRPIEVLPNGFDVADIDKSPIDNSLPADKFVIGHYGTLGADRNSIALWSVIKSLCDKDEVFKEKLHIELVGPTDQNVLSTIRELGLTEQLHYTPYLTHSKCISKMKRASMLLVILNNNTNEEGRVTGKIFEYLATGNNIFGLGSKTSDCAKVINESNAGKMISFDDHDEIEQYITSAYQNFIDNKLNDITLDNSRLRFTRENLTIELASLLNKMVSE